MGEKEAQKINPNRSLRKKAEYIFQEIEQRRLENRKGHMRKLFS